jgi:hypothetical protein
MGTCCSVSAPEDVAKRNTAIKVRLGPRVLGRTLDGQLALAADAEQELRVLGHLTPVYEARLAEPRHCSSTTTLFG